MLSSRKTSPIALDSRINPKNRRSFSGAPLKRGNQRSQDDMKAIPKIWLNASETPTTPRGSPT